MSDNPYEPSPETAYVSFRERYSPAVSTADTIGPRYWALIIDNALAMVPMIPLAKMVHDDYPIVQAIVFVSTYFVYFFACEALTGRSVGKLFLGLVIVQFDGRRITWRQALIRTVLRLFELNPIVGAIPAGIVALSSQYRQRIGDHIAGTIVVKSWRWRRYREELAERGGQPSSPTQ